MRRLTVVPARGGSTRLPGKNLQRLGDRTLVQLACDAAIDAGLNCNGNVTAISSDSSAIRLSHPCCIGIERPAEISGASADIAAAVRHALLDIEDHIGCSCDEVLTLQPTLPVRPPDLIPQMLRAKERYGSRSALTVMPCVPWTWRIDANLTRAANEWHPGPYPRSQDVGYSWAQEINCVTIADRDVVVAGRRWDLPLLLCELPPWAWIDIDTAEDLAEAREWWPIVGHRHLGQLTTHLVTRIDQLVIEPAAAALPLVAGG